MLHIGFGFVYSSSPFKPPPCHPPHCTKLLLLAHTLPQPPLHFCCVKCVCVCGATLESKNVLGSSCVILCSTELGVIMPPLQLSRQSLNWMWQESGGSHGSGQINFLGKKHSDAHRAHCFRSDATLVAFRHLCTDTFELLKNKSLEGKNESLMF